MTNSEFRVSGLELINLPQTLKHSNTQTSPSFLPKNCPYYLLERDKPNVPGVLCL